MTSVSHEHQTKATLDLLKQRGEQGAFNWELAEISLQYNGRIFYLRHHDGLTIRKYKTKNPNTFRYVLEE